MQTVDFAHFRLQPGDRVLDLGCGEGRHAIATYLSGDVQVVGLDIALDDLQAARRKYEPFASEPRDEDSQREREQRHFSLAAANALALPFGDDTFDKIICSEVLEHIADYQAVLEEIRRVLKPGGQLCISVPRRWPEQLCWALSDEYHRVPGGHLRIFRGEELRQEIVDLGFRSYHEHGAHALHAPYWWLKCLWWSRRDSHWLIRQYHRLLVWDLMQRPALTRWLEQALNPVLGKSVVYYFNKVVPA